MSRSGRKLLLFLALVSLFLLAYVSPLYADNELDKKMQELDEITQAIEKYEKLYEQKQKEERKVLGDIKGLEKNIDGLEGDIGSLKGQINTTEELVSAAQHDISITVGHLDERTQYLKQRLCQIYQDGNVSYLEVLLKATSITDFITRFDFMTRLAKNDTVILKELNDIKADLIVKRTILEDKVEHLYNLKSQKESKQQQLEIQSEQKKNLLKSIEEQKEEYIKAINELDDVRKELDRFIMEWQAAHQTAYLGTGKLLWPVPGQSVVTSKFGYRIHPVHKARSFHYAVDLRAPMGTAIVASERGWILFMGTKTAYGKAIIIDHGGGISTQYSHLLSFDSALKIGAYVNRGQVIGKADSTGWSTGSHLDFIVRVNGEPQDPLKYLSKP